jgi:hypothetical protein
LFFLVYGVKIEISREIQLMLDKTGMESDEEMMRAI